MVEFQEENSTQEEMSGKRKKKYHHIIQTMNLTISNGNKEKCSEKKNKVEK